jgi:coenzyme PQQ precursor peptide PqqA
MRCVQLDRVLFVITGSLERSEIDADSMNCQSEEQAMTWTTPQISEVCIGMEVTSYESAEI